MCSSRSKAHDVILYKVVLGLASASLLVQSHPSMHSTCSMHTMFAYVFALPWRLAPAPPLSLLVWPTFHYLAFGCGGACVEGSYKAFRVCIS